MRAECIRALSLVTGVLLASCATFPEPGGGAKQVGLEEQIEATLDSYCLVPGSPGKEKRKLQMLRAQLVLASIAGYATRSILSYSAGHEAQSDGMLVLQRLVTAGDALSRALQAAKDGNHLYPMYHADLIIAAGLAAEAAVQPTARAARGAVFSFSAPISADALIRARAMLINLLENELYAKALRDSCDQLNAEFKITAYTDKDLPSLPDDTYKKAGKFTDKRLEERCAGLRKVADAGDGMKCKPQWDS